MAEGSGANMAEINEIKETKICLLDELEEHRETTPLIYRANPSLRNLKLEHFEGGVISLGLFNRRTWTAFNDGPKEKDSLKIDVLRNFLADIREQPENWMKISKEVVPEPRDMTKLYDRSPCLNLELSSEIIRSALALDSIFIASLSLYVVRHKKDTIRLERTFKCFYQESQHTFDGLWFDIIKMENQVPLMLIGNVIDIIVRSLGEDVSNPTEKRDGVLQIICHDWTQSCSIEYPSCQFDKSLLKFSEYQHLYHCIAGAFWNGANSDTRSEIERRSDRQPQKGDNLRGISRVCLQARSLLSCLKARAVELDEEPNEGPDEESNKEHDVPTTEELDKRGITIEGVELDEEPNEGSDEESNKEHDVPTIEELDKRGITIEGQKDFFPKFKRNKFARWKATLCLPTIKFISDDTEMFWRNLLAFESGFVESKQPLTQYLSFMDELINTERDVSLLSRGKNAVILGVGLGDNKAVATLFNSIMKNVGFEYDDRWTSLIHEINKFYHNPVGRDVAQFEEQYCSKPWLVCSVIAAVILLILTLLQTYYAMWAYYHPS